MDIDATTLSDLEVFRSPDGSEGILQLVDRTWTAAGRRRLRRRLEHPLADVGEIQDAQEAVRFLAAHPDLVRFHPRTLEAVERYLRSNIEVGSGSGIGESVEAVWVALRYRDVLKELKDGVRETVRLFGQLAALAGAVRALRPPEVIGALVTRMGEAARAVLEAHEGAGNVLGADRRLRGTLRGQIDAALDAAAELDALDAMARSTTELGWTMPQIVDGEAFLLDAEGVWHPFVDEPVPNPARLSGGEPMVFLTGPNMAGKTTYLRSVALVVLLAQVGMGVPARRARLTPVEALFTSLNPADNLKAGLSFFLAEVMRVKEAATLLAEGRRALVLFDEVFKGTNVKDALEASAEVILGFARARRSGFVFSSHLAELVEALRASPAIRFCYFDGNIVRGAPRYSYRLKEGVCDQRFGLLLLRQARVPELIARISA